MNPLKREEIPLMRAAGKLAAQTLEHAGKFVAAGITTNELDKIIHEFTLSHGAIPAPLGTTASQNLRVLRLMPSFAMVCPIQPFFETGISSMLT